MDSQEYPREEARPAHRWGRGFPAPPASDGLLAGRRPEVQRFAELLQAFGDLARERGDLILRGSAHLPPLSFALRLQPEPTSAGGELCLRVDGGRLTTWSRAGHPAGRGSGERALRLDLSGAFRWETLIFPDAERMAYTMLRWLEDRVASLDAETALLEEP